MAFIKSQTLVNGAIGNYWRINRLHLDEVTGTMVVTLALYVSAEQRAAAVAFPLPHEVQFVFHDGDHPISEINPLPIIQAMPQDLPAALMYRHIRAVADAALLVEEAYRSQAEHSAVWFADAVDG